MMASSLNSCGPAPLHLVNDIDFIQTGLEGAYWAVVEIPAGSREKWEVDHETGDLFWDERHGVPRVIDYLGYPGNYGFIPQTTLPESEGGDGDALDVLVVGPQRARGDIIPICIVGALRLLDDGERDDKLVGIEASACDGLGLLAFDERYPNARAIIELWFASYDSADESLVQGWMSRDEAIELVNRAHSAWHAGDVHP